MVNTRRLAFLVTFFLVLPAAYFGYRLGQIPQDSAIIERYASQYLRLAGEGAEATDCMAEPHPVAAIRMVITCRAPSGSVATFYAGPRGEPVPPPQAPDA